MRKFDTLHEDVELGAQQQPPLPLADEGKAATPAITLAWRRLDAWVAQKKSEAKAQQVLRGCWGEAQPGQVLSLMGPSGSGKTTLLNILADRPTLGEYGSWSGAVLANGRPELPKRTVGYVMQRDIFFNDLTVREHLKCTAALRLPPEWSDAQRAAELDRVVSLLRLGPALDSMVGGSTNRGISGGELKRLNIATELLAQPQLLVLDEPLSGLDSTLADIVIAALSEVARVKRTTVLMSVHQPSAAMWQQFDQLLLMAEGGRTAFFGAASDAPRSAEATLRRTKPGDRSSAEWLIDLVSREEDRAALVAAHGALPEPAEPAFGAEIVVRPRPAFARSCGALLVRNVANTRRRESKKLEWILNVGLSVIFAGLFTGVGTERLSRQADYISLLFFFVAHWSMHPVFKAVGGYPRQRDVLTRERASDSYPISAWFIANVLGEWAVCWAHPLIFYIIAWPIAQMPLSVAPYLYAVTMLNFEVSTALGNLVAATVFDAERARIVVVVVMVFSMLAGGFFVDLDDPSLPAWLSSVHYLSFQTYTFGLYVRNALSAEEYAAFGPTLQNYSFSAESTLVNVAVLVILALALRGLAYLIVLRSKSLRFS